MKKEGWLDWMDELFAEQTATLLVAVNQMGERLEEMERQSEASNLFYLDLIEKHKRMKQ